MGHNTGTLLPRASIHFFINNEETKKSVMALNKDWRFTRVAIEIFESDIHGAIKVYADHESPDLIFIETDTIGESFTGELESLADVCMAHTGALFIGPVNDIELYRKLIDMGVTDYLVRPLKMDNLISIIANTLVEKKGAADSRFVPVIGSKGGVGTSIITEALGFTMAERLGEKTVLMDAAGGWGNLRLSFGIEPVMQQIEAVGVAAKGPQEDVDQLIYNATEHLGILACGGDPLLGISMSGTEMEAVVDRLLMTTPVVMLDLSHAQSEAKHIAMARANHIVLVTTPIVSSLRNTRRLLQEFHDLRGGEVPLSLVLNMQGVAPGAEVSVDEVSESLGMKPAAILPYSPKYYTGLQVQNNKFPAQAEGRKIMDALTPVAEAIWGNKKTAGAGGQSGKTGNAITDLFNKLKR